MERGSALAAQRLADATRVLAVHDLELSAALYRDISRCKLDDVDPDNWPFVAPASSWAATQRFPPPMSLAITAMSRTTTN
jgi:hypothetical protein